MGNRTEEIREYLRKLAIIREAIQALKRFNEETIRSLSWQNRFLDRSLSGASFLMDLYGPLTDSAVDGIPEGDFPQFILPLSSMVQFGNSFVTMKDRTKDLKDYVSSFEATASAGSALFAMSTGDSTVNFVGFTHTVTSERERLRSLLDNYLKQLSPDEDIKYIESRLGRIVPNISEDFKHFLANYYATTQGEVRYQELIAFRTMVFLKLIDAFAKAHGSLDSTPRKGRILIFASGQPSAIDPNVNQLADAAMSLWQSLSNQDSSAMSVKMGNVTAEYIDLTFRNALVVAAALLRQNAIAWK
jgi:hypothetical protein